MHSGLSWVRFIIVDFPFRILKFYGPTNYTINSGLSLYQKRPIPGMGIDVLQLSDNGAARQLNEGMERVGLWPVSL